MTRLAPFLLLILLLAGCSKEEITNARIAGVYNVFIKGQTEYWFEQLALNYAEEDEIDGFTVWDGEGSVQEIRIKIDKIGRKKISFTIPDQSYDGSTNISGDGVLIDDNIEFYYIIGNLNLSRSYVMSGEK